MNDNQHYERWLKKLLERLTMIYTYHVPNGKPIIDSDRELLHVLYKVYYNGEADHLSKEPLRKEDVKQTEMFLTETTTGLFYAPDTTADNKPKEVKKANGTKVDNK